MAEAKLGKNDTFDRLSEDKETIVYGLRQNLEQKAAVAIVANFEGETIELDVAKTLGIDLSDWQVAIATPDLKTDDLSNLNLSNSQGLLLTKAVSE